MIIDNDPPITRYISVPRDMDQLSCSSLTAGIVEAVLDGLGFVSRHLYCSIVIRQYYITDYVFPFVQTARVTAHNTPIDGFPSRTTILIKLDESVMKREESNK